jgi:hypothetical protein
MLRMKGGGLAAPFEQQATETVQRVRSAFSAVVSALPQHVTRASELQRALGIDKMLAWRIYNVLQLSDPYAAALYVPGNTGVKLFLRAAERSGVPAEITRPAADAVAQFDRLVRTHAGDRGSLEMLLAAHSDQVRAETDIGYRRMLFRGNSYLWGASARVQLRLSFVNFSAAPGELDIATLRGFIGLQRIRPNMSWVIGHAVCVDDAGGRPQEPILEPLYDPCQPDPVAARIFLSEPLPHLRCVLLPDGEYVYELLPGPVGRTGAVKCVSGEVIRRAASYRRSETNEWAMYAALVRTPVEVLVFDYFLHHKIYGRVNPDLLVHGVFGRVEHRGSYVGDVGRLPVLERIEYVGRASAVVHTPDVPQYAEMVRFVFDRLGWDAASFDVYRLRMEYPVMPSDVKIVHPLAASGSAPERPAKALAQPGK